MTTKPCGVILHAVFGGVATVIVLIAFAQPGQAIPAFARKYETSCMTCHVAPPKLNAFGRAFKNMGYRMPKNDEDLIKQKQVPMGAPAYKQIWPAAIWPADIPGGNYFAMSFKSNFTVNPDAEVTNEFDGIGAVALLMGGTVGESLSFFGDFDLYEDGEPGGIGRAYIQYNHPSHGFNITVGQIPVRAQPLNADLTLTGFTGQTDYLTNLFPMVSTGNYYGFSPPQKGIEFWGGHEGPKGRGGLMWAFGVVNGELGESADALADVPELSDQIAALQDEIGAHGGQFDINSGKDFYFQGSYKIGGMGVFGGGAESSLVQTDNWRDDSLTLGGYFYRGTTAAFLNTTAPEPVFDPSGNTFYRAGATFDWWYKDLNIFGGWQRNHDDLKDGAIANAGITTVEANYVLPWPWIQPAVRFELVKPDFGASFHRTTLSTTVLIRANVILHLQGFVKSDSAPDWPFYQEQFQTTLRFLF